MTDEPVMEIDDFGTRWWYLNGELHNEDGPAVETYLGYKEWRLHGKLHNENGPARVCQDGFKRW